MTKQAVDGGPNLPPCRQGLPYTTQSACRELLAGVISQAISDDDTDWICSDTFDAYARLAGLSPQMIFKTRVWMLLNLIDPNRFRSQSTAALRYDAKQERGQIEMWQSWGAQVR